jgi:hypothetical protein
MTQTVDESTLSKSATPMVYLLNAAERKQQCWVVLCHFPELHFQWISDFAKWAAREFE